MKNVLASLIFFLVLTIVTAGASPLHLGTQNRYPLISEKAVSAVTYLQFLKDYATGEKYSSWHWSKYYEPSFMDTKWFASNVSCIKQKIIWSPESGYYYDYSLIPGHGREKYIIEAVSSKKVQEEFNEWSQKGEQTLQDGLLSSD